MWVQNPTGSKVAGISSSTPPHGIDLCGGIFWHRYHSVSDPAEGENFMSARRRHYSQSSQQSISWLEHRSGFPSEAERQALIRRRKALHDELLPVMLNRLGPADAPGRELIKKYGPEEVDQALEVFDTIHDLPSFVADEAYFYRLYRHSYARFGGQRPFLTHEGLGGLQGENLRLYVERLKAGSDFSIKPREKEIEDLLLTDWRIWEDITPPAVPPCPDDFKPPAPAAYRGPAASLLEWGTDLDPERIEEAADTPERWISQIPALERMVLDPGLLEGWPGEAPSWAPWHALQLLGALEAWQSIPTLAALSGRPNDWLADLLSEVWARMGMAAEPILWMLLEDPASSAQRRGLAAEALTFLVEEEPLLSSKLAQGFGQIVQKDQPCDPTLNAYLIHYAQEIGELERILPIAEAAFDEQRVDEEILTLEDLEVEE
jgi:hypothetical protein